MRTFNMLYGIKIALSDNGHQAAITNAIHLGGGYDLSGIAKPFRWVDIITRVVEEQAPRIKNYAGLTDEDAVVGVVYMSHYTQTPWVHVLHVNNGGITSAQWVNTGVYEHHPDFQCLIEQILIDIIANPTCYRRETPAVIVQHVPMMIYTSTMAARGEEVIVS